MNLMIVEDELRLLNNIARNIPWEEHGIDVVATADNGVDALRLFERTKPNIVLLDIQIAELDGLSLARHITQEDPLVKIVVLSGHDDFKYAQSAIDLNVVKYLLKPAGNPEVLKAVLEARERIRTELETLYNQERMQRKWAEHLPRLQDLFCQSWMAGKYAGWELERRSRELMIELPDRTAYTVVVVDIDPLPPGEKRFTADDAPLLQVTLLGLAEELLDRVPCLLFPDYDGTAVLVFTAPLEAEWNERAENGFMADVQQHTAKLLTVFKEYMKVTASAGIGRPVYEKEAAGASYRQAGLALKERVVHGRDIVIPFRDAPHPQTAVPIDAEMEKLLSYALESGQRDKAIEVVDRWVVRAIDRAQTPDEVYENVMFLSALILRSIQTHGWPLAEVLGEQYAYFRRLPERLSKERIVEWLHGTVDSITRYVNERKTTSRHALVTAMIEFVDSGIHEDIGLHEAADKLFINPSYLSRLFKQHMGQSFTAYIVERKMKLAMQWLNEGMKVSETAAMLGYRDFSYFTRVFRKHWGIPPAEAKGMGDKGAGG
ncbi:response regulator [Paenibacillus flagellatus]|uniref:Two-component system response regulator n=1 Tax=Paenibacillus flagellatus TaxID=2211139 RepID=A0A2V5KG99_9BACL|nr:response regulator [Paenibacillus flagellatus]PYI57313.1 two-component system response regulator [Paenibacillus flagellatus]